MRVFLPMCWLLLASLLSPLLACADVVFPICTEPNSIQMNPAVSGHRIVWVDGRYPDPDLPDTGWDIYLYDLATQTETPVCKALGDQFFPAIDGDRIVWLDQRSGAWELYLYDISSAEERKIADVSTPSIYTSFGPDICGDLVVWADDRYNPSTHTLDVMLYDLGAETLTRVTNAPGTHGIGGPRVDNGKIVWCDDRSDPAGDIYMYDVAMELESVVADEPGSESQPDISGSNVVWTKSVAPIVWNVYYRDLTSLDPEVPLEAFLTATQYYPSVAGNWVVWSDYRNGSMDTGATEVYLYDLTTQEVRSLNGGSAIADFKHAVSEAGLVAWMDWRNGDRSQYENPDIYGAIVTRFSDVLGDHWAYEAIEACVAGGVVAGFTDGTYRPSDAVTRDQMAVYIARALAGGDANVPDFSDTPTFPDVPAEHWALKYVEYAVAQGVVGGYADGSYQPSTQVDRGQMAVFVARALVAPEGEAGLADYVPSDPRNFPDVPADYWSYKHIEYCVEHGVVNGYDDGTYRPANVVTRDQMAVYIARAFDLL